jgi:hypothetical protein
MQDIDIKAAKFQGRCIVCDSETMTEAIQIKKGVVCIDDFAKLLNGEIRL